MAANLVEDYWQKYQRKMQAQSVMDGNFDFAQMPPAKERRQLVLNAVAVIVPQRTMDSAGKLLKIDLRTLTDPQESANTCALVASILSLREF